MRLLRLAAALRAPLVLLLISACTAGDAPSGLDRSGASLSVPISAAELPLAADAPTLPINRIRATARTVPGGAVLGTVVLDVDPSDPSWEIELDVDLAALPTVTVVVTFELIHVDASGNESVQYSGRTEPIVIVAGRIGEPAGLVLIRGPAANLDVTAIQITEPLGSVLEGATKTLAATVTTSGAAPTVFWTSLDATATVSGNVATGALPGTARIVATAGAVADTAVLTVLPRPAAVLVTPDSQSVADVGPEVQLTGAVTDARGAVIEGQAVLWRSLTPAILENLGGGRFRTVGAGRGLAQARAAADTTLEGVGVVLVRRPGTDVELTKTGPSGQVGEGDVVEFTVRAANVGDLPAYDVAVNENLPAGLELQSATPSRGTFAAGVWTVGDLAPGASATLVVTARVAAGRAGQTLANVVRLRASAAQEDSNPSNDEARATVSVRPPTTDLGITKTVEVAQLEPRDRANYTITVTNHGPAAVAGVVVAEDLPDGLNFAAAGPSVGTFDQATRRWTIPGLAVGASATLQLAARVGPDASGRLINGARIVGITGAADANLVNNSTSVAVEVEGGGPQDRTFVTVGNTVLVAGAGQEVPPGPHVFSSIHSLSGAAGWEIVEPGAYETALGGTLAIMDDGRFVYAPPTGAADVRDSVSVDASSGDSATVAIRLTFEVDGPVIWYVNNFGLEQGPALRAASALAAISLGDQGSSLFPFGSLSDVEEASAENDWIFVHYGDGTSQGMDRGIDLKDGQRLIGEGAGLVVGDFELVPPGGKPWIRYDDGHAVRMGNGSVVTGIQIRETYGSSIHANGVTDGTLTDVYVENAYGWAIDLYDVHGAWTIEGLEIESTAEEGAVSIHEGDADIAIDLIGFHQTGGGSSFQIESTLGGSVTVTGAAIEDSGGEGITIENNAANIEFHAAVELDHPDNDALEIQDNSGHVYFPDVTIATQGYTALEIDDNTGEVEIEGSVSVVDDSGLGAECDLEGPCGPVELIFSSFVVSDQTGMSGPAIDVQRIPGLIQIGLLDVERNYGEFSETAVQIREAEGLTFRVTDSNSRIVNPDGDGLIVLPYEIAQLRAAPELGSLRSGRAEPRSLAGLFGGAAGVQSVEEELPEPSVRLEVELAELVSNGPCSSQLCAGIGLIGVEGSLHVAGGSITEKGMGVGMEGGSLDFSFGGDVLNVENGAPVYVGYMDDASVLFAGQVRGGPDGGIQLFQNSPDTDVRFTGGMQLTVADAYGLIAQNGGILTATGAENTIEASAGPAVLLLDTEIGSQGMTFESISAYATEVGIGLQNVGTSGTFRVTGSSEPGTGGILAESQYGFFLIGALDAEFGFMDVEDNQIGALVGDLDGSARFEDTEFGGSLENHVQVYGEAGDGELVFDGATFDELSGEYEGSGTLLWTDLIGGTTRLEVTGSSFSSGDYAMYLDIGGSAALDLAVVDTDFFEQWWPLYLYQSGAADLDYLIFGNRFNDDGEFSGTDCFICFEVGQEQEEPPSGLQRGVISGNHYEGGSSGSTGISMEADGTMTVVTMIEDEDLSDANLSAGILIDTEDDVELHATIRGNSVDLDGVEGDGDAIHVDVSEPTEGTPTTCVNVRDNTITSGYVGLTHQSPGTFRVQGFSGSSDAQLITRLSVLNADYPEEFIYVVRAEGAPSFTGGSCQTVPLP